MSICSIFVKKTWCTHTKYTNKSLGIEKVIEYEELKIAYLHLRQT